MGSTDRLKQIDIAQLAHDLKTPLSAMQTAAELIAAEPLSPTQLRYLSILQTAITNMDQTTQTLLNDAIEDFTANETKNHNSAQKLQQEQRQLSIIMQDLQALYQPFAAGKGLRLFAAPFAPEQAHVLSKLNVPYLPLMRALSALISNAINYTALGTIIISSALSGQNESQLKIAVMDTGSGIEPDAIEGLFSPYQRATQDTQTKGSGLGLFGARQIAKDLGGTVELQSTSPKGSVFTFQIPIGPERTQQSNLAPYDEMPPSQASKDFAAPKLTGQVLLVDDNAPSLELISAMLTSFGLTVLPAQSAHQAIQLMQHNTPDIAIIDYTLPDRNGVALAKELSQTHHSKQALLPSDQAINRQYELSVILISAEASLPQSQASFQGPFLQKPLKPQSLYKAVKSLLNPVQLEPLLD
ncbi:hybrid sensor histidine kinase/response regulator [Polycladidibacter stylochi]|uniref:hybrid sensor histidine kinase/response regulator n=1 Tax=Polycladidibacter stylochi TaxID=1807766 RepID=UPI00082D14A2|nr:hybrid sensor histidine kinase/response regulator [Pseudovibrio stylochi]